MGRTQNRKRTVPELYMQVIDPKRIKWAMQIHEDGPISARRLSEEVGYASHAYMTRILRGEIKTVTSERADRIALFLGVPRHDLFTPRLSTDTSQNAKGGEAA